VKHKELLRSLGLSKYEAEVYHALLEVESAKVQDLARMTSVPRPQIYVALGKLMDRGMCTENRGKVSYYTAVAPDVAFRDVLRHEEQELANKAEGVQTLAESFARQEKAEVPGRFVQVLKGRQIKEFIDRSVDEAQEEVLTFFHSPQEKSARSLEAVLNLELGMLKRGVKVRCLYERKSLDNPEITPLLRKLAKHGEEGRVVDFVPLNMLSFDDRAVMFSLTREKGDVTVFVFTHASLVAAMKAGFEHHWQQGADLAGFLDKRHARAARKAAGRK
jgi:sugar-specific transcriptional regulator TrmB